MLVISLSACVNEPEGQWQQIHVEKGQNLFQLSQIYGTTVARLQKKNHLDDPDCLREGQALLVPSWGETFLFKEQDDPSFVAWIDSLAEQAPQNIKSQHIQPAEKIIKSSSLWINPVDADAELDQQALLFKSDQALPVKAARSGEILYAGYVTQWDQTYLVIRHYQGYLSIYQGMRDLDVTVGRYIHQGDVLGYLGEDNHGQYMIHFEIRKNAQRLNTQAILQK